VSLGIALWTRFDTRRQERRRNAAELYSVFADLSRIRHEATDFLKAHVRSEHPLSYQAMHEADERHEMLDATTELLQFWERAGRLIESEYVDRALAREFLRHYLESHYSDYLHRFMKLGEVRPDAPSYRQWASAVELLVKRWKISPPETSDKNLA
jgi:hypothetical protein